MRWMTWQAMGLADVADRVIGRRLTQETRVQHALDDVAGNIYQALRRGQKQWSGSTAMVRWCNPKP